MRPLLPLLLVLAACPTLPGVEDAGSDGGRPPAPPAIGVTAGTNHACARMSDGTVRCWGCYCSAGVLEPLTPDGLPVTIAGVANATQLALGLDLTCALLGDRTVKCWGRGTAGQLGNGATEDRSTPSVVPLLSNVLEISAGERHVCARLGTGAVECWGDNRQGQLGDMSIDDQKSAPSSLGVFGATQLDLGKQHSCALRASGVPVCWGDNGRGQLGDGTVMQRNGPTPIIPPESGSRVSAGGASCLLRDDRGVSCWGNGDVSPLEKLSADGGWNEIAVGGNHVCARAGDTVHCLDAGDITVPGGAVQLAAGDRFTCALTDGGAVYCWGKNNVGQLGDGTTTDSDVPVKVGF